MADIKIYGKLKSATSSGKLLDYAEIDNLPDVIEKPKDLPTEDSVPVVNSSGETSYKKVSELGRGFSIVSAELIPLD